MSVRIPCPTVPVLQMKTVAIASSPHKTDRCLSPSFDRGPQRTSWWVSGLFAVSLLNQGACGPPRPYYAGYMFNAPLIEETDRSYLVRYLDRALRTGKAKRIDIQMPDAGIKSLFQSDADTANTDWLPLPVLYAAEFVLSTKRQGLELDLMARMGPEEFIPVTARYEVDGRVWLIMGKTLSSLTPKPEELPSQEQLKTQYGIAAIRDGNRAWKPYELHALERSLSLLSKDERNVIQGVHFVREARAKKGAKGLKLNEIWGQYHGPGRLQEPRTINLFDVEPGTDTAQFIGEPDHPHPLPSMCILHEIGHAIADHPRAKMNEECHQQIEEAKKLIEQWNALKSAGQTESPEGLVLGNKLIELKQKREEHDLRHERLRASYRRSEGPVHAAFLAVRGPDKGPTKYGRTDVEESFAESFSLYKADPEALRRIYPDVLDWFMSGGHIQAMTAVE